MIVLFLYFTNTLFYFFLGKILNESSVCVCTIQEIRCIIIIVTWMRTMRMTKIYKYYRVGYNYNKNFFFHSLFYILCVEKFVNDICDEKYVCVYS